MPIYKTPWAHDFHSIRDVIRQQSLHREDFWAGNSVQCQFSIEVEHYVLPFDVVSCENAGICHTKGRVRICVGFERIVADMAVTIWGTAIERAQIDNYLQGLDVFILGQQKLAAHITRDARY